MIINCLTNTTFCKRINLLKRSKHIFTDKVKIAGIDKLTYIREIFSPTFVGWWISKRILQVSLSITGSWWPTALRGWCSTVSPITLKAEHEILETTHNHIGFAQQQGIMNIQFGMNNLLGEHCNMYILK